MANCPYDLPTPLIEPARSFLDVTASVTGRAWVDRLDGQTTRIATAIGQKLDLPEILARVLAGRGVGVDDAARYLDPTVRELMPDPSTITGMDQAAQRIAKAIADHEDVALFGDYDVDGACSCALMARFLRHFGLAPQLHIPDRLFEGYGPNIGAIDKLIDAGATLIVTLDCGTTSLAPIAHARDRGIEVLVIDHHLADHALPEAVSVVNPNRPDDISGLGYLCAAGVTFMTLVAVNRELRRGQVTGLPDLMAMLDLVALAAVCDVVPLVGLNRAFVIRGLEIARRGSNPGIGALALAARASGPLNPYHLGFLIGPRINAGGRIGDAALGTRLLSLDDEHEAMVMAAQLDELNTERQRIEVEAIDEAARVAESEIGQGGGPPVLVLASANWHAGIVGLVAARLRERFDRPVFAIALHPDGSGTGSGRSMPGVDLGSAVIEAVDLGLVAKGGGHAMAAGVTVKSGQIGAFRAHLTSRLSQTVAVARAATALAIDAAMTARGATPEFVQGVERAGPFGASNPAPIFAFPAHKVKGAQLVGKGGHVSFSLAADDGARIKAIAFRAAGQPIGDSLLNAGDSPLHIAGTLTLDHWQGRERTQLRVVDVARPKAF